MAEGTTNKWFWVKFWFVTIFMVLTVDYTNGLGRIITYHNSDVSECKKYSLTRFTLDAAIVEIEGFGKVRIYLRECEVGQTLKLQQRTGLIFGNQIFELKKNA